MERIMGQGNLDENAKRRADLVIITRARLKPCKKIIDGLHLLGVDISGQDSG